MSKQIDWHKMSADRWLELAQLATKEEDHDLMSSMLELAFGSDRKHDPRILRHVLKLAERGSFNSEKGCGCKTCVFPDTNGGPNKCPRVRIQVLAMKAMVFGILKTPHDNITDRGRNKPMEFAPYNYENGALLLELIAFIHRNTNYLICHEDESYQTAIRSFLRWMYTFVGPDLDDPLPLLDSMVSFGLRNEIRLPTPKYMEALERIVAADNAGGQLSTMTPGEALLYSLNTHTLAAAECWAILHVKAETRDRRAARIAAARAAAEAAEQGKADPAQPRGSMGDEV